MITVTKQAQNMAEENNLSEEINQAYVDIVGAEYATAEDAAEAYQGQYNSDEEFAQSMAGELGSIDKNVSWPYTCIDWEFAARELMYDYTEAEGYYFRSL